MNLGNGSALRFRTGAAVSVVVLWLKLSAYLRSMLIDFAVFVGGVFYVVRRLVAFLVSLSIILIAFSQMWFTLFRQSDPYCTKQPNDSMSIEQYNANIQCESNQINVYCDRWSSFLRVFTMLLGKWDVASV